MIGCDAVYSGAVRFPAALLASLVVGHFLEPRLPLAHRLGELGGREGTEGTADTGAGEAGRR